MSVAPFPEFARLDAAIERLPRDTPSYVRAELVTAVAHLRERGVNHASTSSLWLIRGSSGRYDDYRTWPVAILPAAAEAEAYAQELTDLACQLYAELADVRAPLQALGADAPEDAYTELWQAQNAAERAIAARHPDPRFDTLAQPKYEAVEVPVGRLAVK